MATRLYGVLLDGLKKPIVNATVVLLAKGNTITVLNGSEAIFKTDAQGAYNVTVQSGYYKVIIGPQGIEPYKAGEIAIYADSPEGSLNSYLVNWAEEDLTPEVIKQVKELVANSKQFALQAGRSAAAAQSDATDARNSKASAAQSASDALVYKNDSKANADAAKQAQAGAAGSANTANAAITTIQGIQREVTASKDRAVTAETNAKASQDASAASATSSANSASAAKSSQHAAKQSENKAKEYVDSIQPATFVVKSQNLADLPDKNTSRNNLSAMLDSKVGLDATTDLNSLNGVKAGFYYQPMSANAKPELNYPIALAGALLVIKTGANTGYSCKQVYSLYNNPNVTYSRVLNASTGPDAPWSEWRKHTALERVEEGLSTTYMYSIYSSGSPRLQVNTEGLWGCSDGTRWIPLAVAQGGTGAATIADAKINLSINRLDQWTSETWIYNHDKSMRLGLTGSTWGCYSDTQKKWIPLDVSHGGTGAITVADARNNLGLGVSSAVKFRNLTLTEALDTTVGVLTKTGRDWNTQHTDNINKFVPIAGSTNGPAGSMVLGGFHAQYSTNYAVQFGGRNSGFWGRTIENGTIQEWKKLLTVDDLNSATDLSVKSVTTSSPVKSGGGKVEILGSVADFSTMSCYVRGLNSTGSSAAWVLGMHSGESKMVSLKNYHSNAEILLNGSDGAVQLKTGTVGGAAAQAITINKDEVYSTVNFSITKEGKRFSIENSANSELSFNMRVWGSRTRQNVFEVGTSAAYLFYAQKTSQGQLFDVNGNINCVTLNQSSDRRLKENINVIADATGAIRKINGYTYTLKDGGSNKAGVIAQEVMEALPEAVGSFIRYGEELPGPTEDGNRLREEEPYLNVDYSALTGLLVQFARESDDRITKLETEIEELKKLVATLVNKETLP